MEVVQESSGMVLLKEIPAAIPRATNNLYESTSMARDRLSTEAESWLKIRKTL